MQLSPRRVVLRKTRLDGQQSSPGDIVNRDQKAPAMYHEVVIRARQERYTPTVIATEDS